MNLSVRDGNTIMRWGYIALAVTAFSYIAYRTTSLPLVSDEAFTFLYFVHPFDFLPLPQSPWSANNHFLNSLFIFLSYKIFGIHEWSVRLPNLLALGIFLFFIYRLGFFIKQRGVRIIFYLSILGSHYLLSFFGYARGYGLSLAFLTMAVFYLIRAGKKENPAGLNRGLIAVSLSLLSNFNILFCFLLWVTAAVFIAIKRKARIHYTTIIFAALSFILAVVSIFILKNRGELYLGHESLWTFLRIFAKSPFSFGQENMFFLLGSFTFLILLALGTGLKKHLFLLSKPATFTVSAFFLFGNFAALILLNILLKSPYPVDRTSLHLLLLLFLTVFFAIDILVRYLSPLFLIGLLPFFGIPFKFFNSIDFRSASEGMWPREQIPETFYNKIGSFNKDFPPTISAVTNSYNFTWGFLNLKNGGKLNRCQINEHWAKHYDADYQIIDTVSHPEYNEKYRSILYDEASALSLMERKKKLKKKLLNKSEVLLSDSRESPLLWQDSLKTNLPGKLQLDYEVSVTTDEKPLKSWIIVQLLNDKNEQLLYQDLRLDYFLTKWKGDTVKCSTIIHQVPEGTAYVKTFLWNEKKGYFSKLSARTKVYELTGE